MTGIRHRAGERCGSVHRRAAGRLARASTAAAIALEVLETCFPERLTEDAWLPALRLILPTYGLDLKTDAAACRQSRAETAKVLGIVDV